jgi:hypothetical protein
MVFTEVNIFQFYFVNFCFPPDFSNFENHNFTVGARTLIGEPHPYLK